MIPNSNLARLNALNLDKNRRTAGRILEGDAYDDVRESELMHGIISYAASRGFDEAMLKEDPEATAILRKWHQDTCDVRGESDTRIVRRQTYVFSSPPLSLSDLAENACDATRMTAEFVGDPDVFLCRSDRSSNKTRYVHDIDGSNYLSLKAGTGIGTFALDLALGVPYYSDWERVKGEYWRVGFDVAPTNRGNTFRFLRAGSAMTAKKIGHGSKNEAAKEFFTDYRVRPARALALTSLFLAHFTEGVDSIAAPTRDVFSDRLQTHGRVGSKIKFNYEAFWKSLGFGDPDENGWMWIENDPDSFYAAVLDHEKSGIGMHGGEQSGVESMLAWVRAMQSTRTDGQHTIATQPNNATCDIETRAAWLHHRAVHSKGRSSGMVA